jgi:hypothetical protein
MKEKKPSTPYEMMHEDDQEDVADILMHFYREEYPNIEETYNKLYYCFIKANQKKR